MYYLHSFQFSYKYNFITVRWIYLCVYFSEFLYVTDWRLDAILRMDKESGVGEQIVASVEEGSRLYGIKVFSRENQKVDS